MHGGKVFPDPLSFLAPFISVNCQGEKAGGFSGHGAFSVILLDHFRGSLVMQQLYKTVKGRGDILDKEHSLMLQDGEHLLS